VDFELGISTAQTRDWSAGRLNIARAHGGPRPLTRQPFCIGINDPLGMLPAMPGACAATTGFTPQVFSLFEEWTAERSRARAAIARGETIFNTRQFVIDNVPGLNGAPSDPVPGVLQHGTCTVCHDTPNAGNHSVAMALNIGIADASRRMPDVPLYTLRKLSSGDLVQTTDPGRAMITGRWNDIGKFKGPVLRALAARAPYFHDGSADSLEEVISFYNTRFKIQLTDQEKDDLAAFLRAL
jgi:cytochrome c peroxidase